MYRILPKVALLLNIVITFAGGQQSFYSANGQASGSHGHYNVNSNLSPVPAVYGGVGSGNTYGPNPYGAVSPNYAYNPGAGYSQQQPMPQMQQQTSFTNPVPVVAGYPGSPGQQQAFASAAPGAGQVNPAGGFVSYASQPTMQTPGGYAGQPQQSAPTSFAVANQNGGLGQPQVQPSSYSVQPQQQQQSLPGGGVYSGSAVVNPQPTLGNTQGFAHRQLPLSNGPVGFAGGPGVGLPGPSSTAASMFNAGHSGGPTALPPGQLMSRRGPFDGMINRAKEWMPALGGKTSRVKSYFNVGAHDSHRVPKPPKYPLYDIPSEGMATPPPAPLMSPMNAMPSNMYSYSVPPSDASPFASASAPQPHRGGRPSQPPPTPGRRNKPKGLGKRRRNRPAPPPPQPPPPPKYRGKSRQRPRGKPKHPKPSHPRNSYSNIQVHDGYDHPMASNTVPVNSPPLGRPLGYDEYMKKPTHSFTDDPWNFDPNAQSYSEGMNTHAMKYNYDPLGMNTLDMSVQTHLDATKMSYPGDVMHLDSMQQPPKPLSSQVGGWDASPDTYRTTPHRVGDSFSRFDDQHPEGSSFAFDDMSSTSTTVRNSFNQYDSGATESPKSETINPLSLFSSPDGGATFELDLDALKGATSTGNNGNNYDNYKSGSSSNYDNYKSNSGSNYDNYKPNSGGNNYDNYKSGSSSSNYDNYKSDSGNNYDNYKSGGSNYDNYKSRSSSHDSYKSGSDYRDVGYDNYKPTNSYDRYKDRSGSDHRDHRDRFPDETPSTSDFARGKSSSNYDRYNSYSGSDYSRYGSRHTRADGVTSLGPRSSTNDNHKTTQPLRPVAEVNEGIELFHDFIKDPNPGSGKAKARQTLYKALLS